MPDYKNGKVYKIVCNITGKVYVGSTTQTLSMRLTGHRKEYKRFKEGKRNNVSSFDIIQQGNYDIVLIENVSCESKEELHRQERHFIEFLECVNKCIPNGLFTVNYTCECGSQCIIKGKQRHFRTEKHKQFIFKNK